MAIDAVCVTGVNRRPFGFSSAARLLIIPTENRRLKTQVKCMRKRYGLLSQGNICRYLLHLLLEELAEENARERGRVAGMATYWWASYSRGSQRGNVATGHMATPKIGPTGPIISALPTFFSGQWFDNSNIILCTGLAWLICKKSIYVYWCKCYFFGRHSFSI